MALVSKLAQSAPSATTLTDAYTVPASTQFVGRVVAANRSAVATTIRVSLAPDGAADATSQYIAYDIPLVGNDVYQSAVFAINAADVVRVYTAAATVTFSVTGLEKS